MIVPLFTVTSVTNFVVCCATAIPAPSLVAPLPFGVTLVGTPLPVIVAPFTMSFPALISIPVSLPVTVALSI